MKNTPYFSPMCIKFIQSAQKPYPLGPYIPLIVPYSGVIPTRPPPEPKTHKSTLSLPENFRVIFYGSSLDPFGFKMKTVCFERLIESSYSLFFYPFLAMRDGVLSSGPLRGGQRGSKSDAIFTFQHISMSEENST